MVYSLLLRLLQFIAFLSLLLPLSSSFPTLDAKPLLTYHNGPLLSGNLKLAIHWYGEFGRIHKSVIHNFINSLNGASESSMEPRLSSWWKTIESYQFVVKNNNSSRIQVRVVKQTTDNKYSVGKFLSHDNISGLVNRATGGDSGSVAVIFTSRDVSVHGFCMGKCSEHGTVGSGSARQVYIMVSNPETKCPGKCAWPFRKPDFGPHIFPLLPPNENVGADALVIGFATSLAGAVTNPYNDGYFWNGEEGRRVEAVSACPGMFGSGAFPGFAGKVRIDPATGGYFNARGNKGMKFLVPAVWNPRTSSCWTTM